MSAIVCGDRQMLDRICCNCHRIGTQLCDWKTGGTVQEPRTCDKPVCPGCTFSPAEGKDLCPKHRKAFEEWQARRKPKDSPGGEAAPNAPPAQKPLL